MTQRQATKSSGPVQRKHEPTDLVIRYVRPRSLRQLLYRAYRLESMPMPKSQRPECGKIRSSGAACCRPTEWDHEAEAPGRRCKWHGGARART